MSILNTCHLVATSCPTLSQIPRTVARQAPLSLGFPKQEYWSGLPFPSPGSLPEPGIEPESPALHTDSLPLSQWGSALMDRLNYKLLLFRFRKFTPNFMNILFRYSKGKGRLGLKKKSNFFPTKYLFSFASQVF